MSTTCNPEVAAAYSASGNALLFKIKTVSFMDRGADLTYLSAFPAEREFLYPPLTFLKPTGKTQQVQAAGGGMFNVVEVEPKL